MAETAVYTVPEMSCSHCEAAVTEGLMQVAGVGSVDVDLGSKTVTVSGERLDDATLRAAVSKAGYEAE